MKRLAAVGVVSLAAALVGCGGGGGDGPSTPTNPAPGQIESLSVWKSFISADRTFTTRGAGSDGNSFEISTTIRPRGTVQFARNPDVTVSSYTAVEVTNAVKRNGAAYSNSSLLFYVLPTDFSLAAMIDPTGTTTGASCIVPESALQTPPVPNVAVLNATGRLFNGDAYVYNGNSTRCFPPNGVIGAPTHTLTWSYEADGSKPLFCVNMRVRYPGGVNVSDQNSCFEVMNLASVGGAARVSVTSPTLSFVTKNY